MSDALQDAPFITANPTPPIAPQTPPAAPALPDAPFLGGPAAPAPARAASGPLEAMQAGWQGSVPGLFWRRQLPELISDPANAAWWERALTGLTAVGLDLPLMAVGGAAGAAFGGGFGGGVAGPPGAAAGVVLGTGAGMFGVPAAMRETLIQSYKSGENTTVGGFFTALSEVAKATLKEAGIGMATTGAGAVAARTLGAAIAPTVGTAISSGMATKAIGTTDVAAQIAAMVTVPAALEGRMPHLQDFVDAAIVIAGLKGAHVGAERLMDVYSKTGKTPAEVVAEVRTNPTAAEDLVQDIRPNAAVPTIDLEARTQSLLDERAAIPEAGLAEGATTAPLARAIDAATSPAWDYAKARESLIWALDNNRTDIAETIVARANRIATEAETKEPPADTRLPPGETASLTMAPPEDLRREANSLTNLLAISQKPQALEDTPVYRQILDALEQVGRFSEEQNRAYAAMTAAFFRTKAERLGKTPEELFAEYGPKFTTLEPGEPDVLDSGTMQQTKSPNLGLEHPEVRATLQRMIDHDEIGWAEIGGRLDIARLVAEFGPDAIDENYRPTKLGVVAFTSWVPKADWWTGRPGHPGKGLNEKGVRLAIEKALRGEKLRALEKRTIDYLVGVAEDRIAASNEIGPERFADITALAVEHELEPTTKNIIDADAVARAQEKDEAAFERAVMEHQDDDAAFMAAIRRINGEEEAGTTGTEAGSDRAPAEPAAASGRHPAADAVRAGAASKVAWSDVADVFDRFDSPRDGKYLTERDVLEEVEFLLAEGRAPQSLEEPATRYREALREDYEEFAGRGDVEQAREDFMAAVEAAARETSGSLYQTARSQTDTPEFRRFFAGSKVVDKDGKPLVVYHGTRADFSAFREEPGRKKLDDNGYYFTDSQGEASDFATAQGFLPAGGNVMPVYLALKNPAVHDFKEQLFKATSLFDVVREARDAGRDGVIVENIQNFERGPISTTYIVFKPEQIKSAIGNRGTFDLTNPNVLYQPGRPDTWWYSALARQVDSASMKGAPAQGWKDWLKGQTGKGAIKADEIKWSGLEEWLDLQVDTRPEIALPTDRIDPISGKTVYELGPNPAYGKSKVTKEQVAEFLKTGGVKVDEVMLGSTGERGLGDAAIASDMAELNRRQWTVEQSPDEAYYAFADRNGDIADIADMRVFAATDAEVAGVLPAAERVFAYMNGRDAPPRTAEAARGPTDGEIAADVVDLEAHGMRVERNEAEGLWGIVDEQSDTVYRSMTDVQDLMPADLQTAIGERAARVFDYLNPAGDAAGRLRALGWEIERDPQEGNVTRFVNERENGEVMADAIPLENNNAYDLMVRVLEGDTTAEGGVPQGWGSFVAEVTRPAKFSSYQLPGGRNYRELLLTLPNKDRPPEVHIDRNTLLPHGWRIEQMADGRWTLVAPNGQGHTMAGVAAGAERWQATEEAIGELRHAGYLNPQGEPGTRRFVDPGFRSSHFDEPNILAHVRFNERVDADGKRVLFVEEFQSDWAQQGRKQGFSDDVARLEAERARIKEEYETASEVSQESWGEARSAIKPYLRGEARRRANGADDILSRIYEASTSGAARADWMRVFHVTSEARAEIIEKAMDDMARVDRLRAALDEATPDKPASDIPRAPFVEKTEAWTALALKRMIRYAAEQGFDRIAWTRGEQQVERYTSALRKAVDVIEWEKTPEGIHLVGFKGRATAEQRERAASLRDRIHEYDQTINRLLDTVDTGNAQELTGAGRSQFDTAMLQRRATVAELDKIEARGVKVVDTTEKETALSDAIGKAMADRIINDPAQKGTIEGENIRVDKTGMAGFYDRMLPSVAKDVIKKLGGGKIGDIEVNIVSANETNRKKFTYQQAVDELAEGRPVIVEVDGEKAVVRDSAALERAWNENEGAKLFSARDDILTNQGFDITPEMQAKAMQGLPLFQRQGPSSARGYYTPEERRIGFLENADASTFIHESGHFYLDVSADLARAPDAAPQLKADMQTVFDWLGVKDGATWDAMTLDEKRPFHERWARGFEQYVAEGRAPSAALARAFQRFKEWLLQVYRTMRGLDVGLTPEVRRVMDRMLATDEEIAQGVPRAYAQDAVDQRSKGIVPGDKAQEVAKKPFADELPQAPGEPAKPTHVNYNRINTAEDTKLALARVSEIYEAEIQTQRRGTVSWEETSAEAGAQLAALLGAPQELIMPRTPGTPAAAAELLARKQMTVGAAEEMMAARDHLLERGAEATNEDKLAFLASIERLSMIQAEFLGARAEAGRALNILKMTKIDADRARQIQDVIRLYGDNPVEMARMMGEIENAKGAVKFAKEVTTLTAGAGKLIGEVQAVLQAHAGDPVELQRQLEILETKKVIRTDPEVVRLGVKDVRKIIEKNRGNPKELARIMDEISTPEGAKKFAEDAMRPTLWDKIVEAWKAGILSGPATHVANILGNGMFMALRPAIDAAAVVTGRARMASATERVAAAEPLARLYGDLRGTADGLRLAWHVMRTGEEMGKAEQHQGAIGGITGEIVRTPFRLLSSADALFRTMNERGEAYALAARQASAEGLSPLTREYTERIQTLVDNPTEAMTEQIQGAGKRFTFNTELGDKGRAVQNLVRTWHLELIVPFIRTPANIAQELIRMTPGAPLIGEWSNAMRRGGAERDKAIAELVVGTAIMGLVVSYAFDGLVSGQGEPDSGKKRINRAAGWQPYSVKIGDTWYSYNRLQPLGTLLGIAADMAEVWDHANEEESDKIPKMIGVAFANAITNQTFLQGITNLVMAISEPDRRMAKLGQQFAASLVPNIIGQPTQIADPLARRVDSMVDAIRSRIPGERQKLLPKIDAWGENQPGTDRVGSVAPIVQSKESEDKVKAEAMRLGLSAADAPKKTHLGRGTGKAGDTKLEPEQQNLFAQASGKLAMEILTPIVNAPGWDELPPLIKKRAYAKAFLMGHRAGAMAALPPEKRRAMLDDIMIKIQTELTPEPVE